jgi:hypothetical protein
VVTFNASATQTGVQAVLDALDFSNSNAAPLSGVRAAVFHFTDGNGNASRPVAKDVIVTPAAAIKDLGGPVTYTGCWRIHSASLKRRRSPSGGKTRSC